MSRQFAMLRCGSAHEAGHIYSVALSATAENPMAKANKANGAHGFPREITLPNGTAIMLRLMQPGDKDKILIFARALPQDDLLFLRTDITEPASVEEWIRNVESGDTATVLAEADGHLVGYASVHSDQARWTRRVGEIRVQVGAKFRGVGL